VEFLNQISVEAVEILNRGNEAQTASPKLSIQRNFHHETPTRRCQIDFPGYYIDFKCIPLVKQKRNRYGESCCAGKGDFSDVACSSLPRSRISPTSSGKTHDRHVTSAESTDQSRLPRHLLQWYSIVSSGALFRKRLVLHVAVPVFSKDSDWVSDTR